MAVSRSGHAPFVQGGESRQLFARDLRRPKGDDIVFLPEGAAADWRAECHAGHLICPVAECPQPRLSTRGGSRRDHFFHVERGAGRHGDERWYHVVGKALVAESLRDAHPSATVRVEARIEETGQVADVLVISPTGRRAAVEIQYATLTIEEWQRRTALYEQEADIPVTWVFGHLPPHRQRLRAEADAEKLLSKRTPLLNHLRLLQRDVWFIDPDSRCIAFFAADRGECAALGVRTRPGLDEAGLLVPESVTGLRFAPDRRLTTEAHESRRAAIAAARATPAAERRAATTHFERWLNDGSELRRTRRRRLYEALRSALHANIRGPELDDVAPEHWRLDLVEAFASHPVTSSIRRSTGVGVPRSCWTHSRASASGRLPTGGCGRLSSEGSWSSVAWPACCSAAPHGEYRVWTRLRGETIQAGLGQSLHPSVDRHRRSHRGSHAGSHRMLKPRSADRAGGSRRSREATRMRSTGFAGRGTDRQAGRTATPSGSRSVHARCTLTCRQPPESVRCRAFEWAGQDSNL